MLVSGYSLQVDCQNLLLYPNSLIVKSHLGKIALMFMWFLIFSNEQFCFCFFEFPHSLLYHNLCLLDVDHSC